MIVVRIIGGLGNQLFQYATARALADACGEELYLDCRGFAGYDLRNFTLGRFNIRARIADETVQRRFPEWQRRVGRRLPFREGRLGSWLFEKHLMFYPDLMARGGDLFLDGYFQWERYFLGREDAIRADLTLRGELPPSVREMEMQIRSAPALAIHVRRGDYVANAVNQRMFGSCSPDYYRHALAHVREQVGPVRLFIFSDDQAFARTLFADQPDAVFIDGSHDDPADDMYLMSCCDHHIIANSSFSWWGAWLGRAPGQVVVAPEPWFDWPAFAGVELAAEGWHRITKS
ncbi:MAG: alpha-1,2-fucosyltransferase [Pseudomonadota bacterium]